MVDYHSHEDFHTNPFLITLFLVELTCVIFFALAADYANANDEGDIYEEVQRYYPMYQDVHVMIFIGFGFLMTFLRKNGFNALGQTFLLGALSIQMGIMFETCIHGWFTGHSWKVTLTLKQLIRGDFAAGAVLISMGAVLGRATWTQLIWMAFFELIFYAINEYVGVHEFEAVDMGGSMFVHTFGAFFGLAFSTGLGNPTEEEEEKGDESSIYHSDMFAMIGTIFLWMYWPSFNGALAGDHYHQQERVIINTVLALTCSCISAFFWSHFYCGKLDMVHIQNASLAGGVAVGSSSDLVVGPYAAILIGLAGGFVSVTGYVHLTPKLNKIGIYDVCGVHNLHGMPGVIGAVAGAISAAGASTEEYGSHVGDIFPARSHGRTASEQGWYQAATLGCTLAFAIVGGLFTGFVVGHEHCTSRKQHIFQDVDTWELPHTGYANTLSKELSQESHETKHGEVELQDGSKI